MFSLFDSVFCSGFTCHCSLSKLEATQKRDDTIVWEFCFLRYAVYSSNFDHELHGHVVADRNPHCGRLSGNTRPEPGPSWRGICPGRRGPPGWSPSGTWWRSLRGCSGTVSVDRGHRLMANIRFSKIKIKREVRLFQFLDIFKCVPN